MDHRLVAVTFLFTPGTALTIFDPNDPKSCKIIGDADIYGIGIRIGFYLQWASVLFAIWLVPEVTKNIRINTNIVTTALYINLFRGAHLNGLIFLEGFLVFWMTVLLLAGNVPWNR